MKKNIFCIYFVLISTYGYGQNPAELYKKKMIDSLKTTYIRMAALKYPGLRQAGISTDMVSRGNINSELYDKDFFDGKSKIARVRAHFAVPVSTWKKNTVTSSFVLTNQRLQLNEITSYNAQLPILNVSNSLTTLSFSTSYSRSDSLFGKPVSYTGIVSGLTNASLSRGRMVYSAIVMFSLVRNSESTLSVGGVFISDPSSVTPFAPLVIYSRKLNYLGLELFVDFPQRIALRKELTSKSSVSLGSELAGNLFFMNLHEPTLPKKIVNTTLALKSGLTYEHMISKSAVLGISGGLFSNLNSKVMDRKAKPSEYFISNKIGSEPYLNITLSFLPFWKGLDL